MAAKIALKMARVRQLDAVLEEKLGKALYAPLPPPFIPIKKGKGDRSNPQEPGEGATTGLATHSSSGGGAKKERALGSSSRSSHNTTNQQNHFVNRNRDVIAHGMKPVLSSDEEARLDRLLRELESQESAGSDGGGGTDSSLVGPTTTSCDTTVTMNGGGRPKARKDRVNLIQAAKEERLRTQRLEHIEREIQFLQDTQNARVAISPDDNGDGDSDADNVSDFLVSDGAESECSFATSVASTRSGVISRRQFRSFIATELLEFQADGAKASPDAIRQLVASLTHLTSRSAA